MLAGGWNTETLFGSTRTSGQHYRWLQLFTYIILCFMYEWHSQPNFRNSMILLAFFWISTLLASPADDDRHRMISNMSHALLLLLAAALFLVCFICCLFLFLFFQSLLYQNLLWKWPRFFTLLHLNGDQVLSLKAILLLPISHIRHVTWKPLFSVGSRLHFGVLILLGLNVLHASYAQRALSSAIHMLR